MFLFVKRVIRAIFMTYINLVLVAGTTTELVVQVVCTGTCCMLVVIYVVQFGTFEQLLQPFICLHVYLMSP